jgi:methionyl-tRNA formyltransferase
MTTRVVFMGSPEFSLPTLEALIAARQGETQAPLYEVVGVVTQPDRLAGRGRTLTSPPVKILSRARSLPLIQPQRLREPSALAQLHAWHPELIVVAAFGQILRSEILILPLYGCLNVHASLLPRWRGAAPIQAAILAGDAESGVTIMKMDAGVDTGPLLAQRACPILEDDTAASLSPRLAKLGATLLIETLPAYLAGALSPQPQPEKGITYAPMLKKEDGQLDFTHPAVDLARRVRAFDPWPGAFTLWQGQILKIRRAHPVQAASPGPGATLTFRGLPAFGCGDGLLVLDELQQAGKKPMPGAHFLRGTRGWG